MKVGDLCTRDVVVVERDAGVVGIAALMREHHVGDVVVVESRDGRRVPIGIVTDRDIVVELVAEGVAIDTVSASDIMAAELLHAREGDDVWDTLERMRERGVRRTPVVDATGRLVGVLAVDDLIEFLGETLGSVARLVARERYRERRLRA